MKIGLKLGIVALSLVVMATTIYTSTVKALDKTVSVTIVGGVNTCTLDDYDFGTIQASTGAISLTGTTKLLSCDLLRSASGTITLQLFDLVGSDTSATIASGNFSATLSATTVNGSLENEVAVTSSMSLGSIQDLYAKGESKIGTMSREVTISGIINAGQQVDTYTGALIIFVPNGN